MLNLYLLNPTSPFGDSKQMNIMTKAQQKVFNYIVECRENNLPAPTLLEIAKFMRFNTSGMAQTIVNSMIDKGFLTHKPGTARSLIAVEQKNEAE